MGHIRLGRLYRTRQWDEVIDLIRVGAGTSQVATATINAAEKGLLIAARDPGVLETVWLLLHLPSTARQPDFPSALQEFGIPVQHPPTLLELLGAFTDAVDSRLHNNVGRTDLGEMAQSAAVETLARQLGTAGASLFETTGGDVRRTLAGFATPKRFGALVRQFFARLTFKCLDYFLSRVLTHHTGDGRRFTTIAEQASFSQALETHCHEAAFIVEKFSASWTGKARRETGSVPRSEIPKFVGGAVKKLIGELKEGAHTHGD